ncbi:MAG: amino acid adenylation domain-containing protein [Legionellaceae bacterium]|nr:amino acid adenylation domain-containing protein [Legionellaceae bacterium]
MPFLTQEEYQTIIYDWNNSEKIYSDNNTIHQLFENQVKKTPNDIAVIFLDQHMTYFELNEASNQLARYIRRQFQNKLSPDSLIALCLEPSLDMIIAILGTLKAGAAYVPISPTYPTERIIFQLEDTNSELLITETLLLDGLQRPLPNQTKAILLDNKPYQNELKDNLKLDTKPSDLAYVIYTSGTTGKPKGVMVEHREYIFYQQTFYDLVSSTKNIITSFTLSYCFDASLPTLFSGLLSGGKVIITKDLLTLSSQEYLDILSEHRINIIRLTPSMLNGIVPLLLAHQSPLIIVLGGEIYDKEVINILLKNEHITIFNQYGPTECIVGSSGVRLSSPVSGQIIGKPYAGKRVYVLDSNKEPVPIGSTGELYIGGAGLARGYLNQPELTAERFIESPFSNGKLYRTGDLVRWLPDGNLEYIGRDDFQVKIRGYRIELGEIESVLRQHGDVDEVVVIACDHTTNQQLIAYIVASEFEPSIEELDSYIDDYLSDYMRPSRYLFIDAIPLNTNGKIDRKSLPIPDLNISEVSRVSPCTDLETKICSVWKQILRVESIGIEDDFFRLGGDSIQSIQVSAELQRAGIDCRARDISMHRTISALSRVLIDTSNTTAEQGELEGVFDLLPVQTWFFEQNHSCLNHWDHAFLVRIPTLSIEKLEACITPLFLQHDIFRLRFTTKDNGTRQQVYDTDIKPPNLQLLNISDMSYEEIQATLTLWQSGFNPASGPLWQIAYLYGYTDGSARLYFAHHYLILDAMSWRILIDDVKRLYDGQALGQKGSSYRQWVKEILAYPKTHPNELEYWLGLGEVNNQKYPVLREPSYITSVKLDLNTTKQLLTQAHEAYHTNINDLLLTALAYSLQDCLDKTHHVIMLAGHGRKAPDTDVDVSRTLGWFTSFYPVELTTKDSIKASIQYIKENLHRVPNQGVLFGAYKQAYPDILSSDLPKITFNYQGQFDSNSSEWMLSGEQAGMSDVALPKQRHILSIIGRILDGALCLSISTHISSTLSKQFATAFELRLKDVVLHCLEQPKPSYTPCDFDTVNISQDLIDKLQASDQNIEAIYPANNLQQGFIYHAISQPDDDAYRVQVLLDYHSSIRLNLYKQAWVLAIKAYPILRTYFNWDEDLIQVISKDWELNFTYHDIQRDKNKKQAINKIQKADREQAFNIQSPTLLRLHLIQCSESNYTLLRSMHHSIVDGWSAPILLNQVHAYYEDLCQGIQPNIKIDTAYLRTQEYIYEHKKEAYGYWKTALQDTGAANDLNALLSHTTNLDKAITVFKPKELTAIIDGHQYHSLKKLALQEGITLHAIVQFAWHKLIQTYTGASQTIVGTTVSGRTLPVNGIESSVGLYINTLPLIVNWDNHTVQEQLQLIETATMTLNEYSYVDLASLQHDGERLFHSLLLFNNYPSELRDITNILHFDFQKSIEKVDYPLTMIAQELHNNLQLQLNFDACMLTEKKANNLITQLTQILSQLSANLDKPTEMISLLTDIEYQTVVYDWNQTYKKYPQYKTIHQLFEVQVNKTPDNIAGVFEDTFLTYRELNEKSNQLARYIMKKDKELNPDTLIALCLERSLDIIIAILGVLKAGAAYVPLNPSNPSARIRFQLENSKSKLLLTQSHILDRLTNTLPKGTHPIALDQKSYQNESSVNLKPYAKSNNLAYVIYTSGTTGQPKGVLVTHSSALNTLMAVNEYFNVNSLDKCLALSNLSFDLSVYDVLGFLIVGGTVVLPTEIEAKDPKSWGELINAHHVTIWNSVPQLMMLLVDNQSVSEVSYPSLRAVLLSGDKIPPALPVETTRYAENAIIMSLGGATEAGIWSIWHDVTKFDSDSDCNSIPYGRAMPNQTIYILNSVSLPCPIGVPGEIYIGGKSLASGYWSDDKKTKKSFVNHSIFGALYRTGDIGAWSHEGYVEFYGRNDLQVKIRGYRIELGEIEHKLTDYPGIQHAVIVLHESHVVAYYVGDVDKVDLESHLRASLPDYMIPSQCIALTALPLTFNGKIDHKKLPIPEYTIPKESYVEPRNAEEERICKLWQMVLNVESVGINDDFFHLGGNSISAIKVISRMNKLLGLYLTAADLLQHKTIKSLSDRYLNNKADTSIIKILTEPQDINRSIYFIHPLYGGCEFYKPLADVIIPKYQSIGIDNGYLSSYIKTKKLTLLSSYYLNEIKNMLPGRDDCIRLCGFSSAGNIALEMAYLLEQQGVNRIKVFLLDTNVNFSDNGSHNIQFIKSYIKQELANAEIGYLNHVLSYADTITSLTNEPISGKLLHTDILQLKTVPTASIKYSDMSYIIQPFSTRPISTVYVKSEHRDIINHGELFYRSILKMEGK